MNQENSAPSPFGVGIITIITVLLVLTLSIFAALTLTSAKADLALSRINADTVSACYEADAQAARLYVDFAAGSEARLEQYIPIDESQSLYLNLRRVTSGEQAGSVAIDHWEVVTAVPDEDEIQNQWNLWDGETGE